jgi:hypothetical protein
MSNQPQNEESTMNNDYYNSHPELGEAAYEAEQVALQDHSESQELDNFNDAWFGQADSEFAIENEAMNRSEESYEDARQQHLLGAW